MNIIYLHGFASSPNSMKAQMLQVYCEQHADLKLHLPNLNMPVQQVLPKISEMIHRLSDVVLIGSSLGGFYATQLALAHAIPAVVINPAIRPWQLFRHLYGANNLPYVVHPNWTLDEDQLVWLEQMAQTSAQDAGKILVLLQQGDEVLDYREAEHFYTGTHSAMLITEAKGNHAMDDFAQKIPLALQFLADCLK
jgi:uncharacterized protein